MARLFNAGSGSPDSLHVPTIKRVVDGKVVEFVRVPSPWARGPEDFIEHKPGNVYVSLGDFGFHVVEKGKPFDVPHGCPVEAVKALAPHLVDEAEFLSMKAEEAKAEPASEPRQSKAKEK